LSLHLHLKVKNPENLHFFWYLSAAEYLTTVVKKKNISYVLKLLPSDQKNCVCKRDQFYSNPDSCALFGLVWGTPLHVLTLQLLANALASAASAALAIGWVGKHGVNAPPLLWTAVCDEVNTFCKRIEGAIIASFIAWLFLALSAAVAVSSLHNLGRRRN
jgi:hypothetical protein